MKIEMVHLVTEAEKELAAVATPGGRIIVGIDDSPGGQAALRPAVAQARSSNARLVGSGHGHWGCLGTVASGTGAWARSTRTWCCTGTGPEEPHANAKAS